MHVLKIAPLLCILLVLGCSQSEKKTSYQQLSGTKRIETAYDCEKRHYLSDDKKKSKKSACDSKAWKANK